MQIKTRPVLTPPEAYKSLLTKAVKAAVEQRGGFLLTCFYHLLSL